MNSLWEVLSTQAPLATDDLRDATLHTVKDLQNDRRLVPLDPDSMVRVDEELQRAASSVRVLSHYPRPPIEPLVPNAVARFSRLDMRHLLLLEVDDAPHEGVTDVELALRRIGLEHGVVFRQASLPFRLHIFDNRAALLGRDFDDNRSGGWLIEEPSLLSALTALHSRVWRDGQRLNGALLTRAVDPIDVLRELQRGTTDEVAAQRLHVSLRTYRRAVQDLLARLRVHHRFAAARRAEQLGLFALFEEAA